MLLSRQKRGELCEQRNSASEPGRGDFETRRLCAFDSTSQPEIFLVNHQWVWGSSRKGAACENDKRRPTGDPYDRDWAVSVLR